MSTYSFITWKTWPSPPFNLVSGTGFFSQTTDGQGIVLYTIAPGQMSIFNIQTGMWSPTITFANAAEPDTGVCGVRNGFVTWMASGTVWRASVVSGGAAVQVGPIFGNALSPFYYNYTNGNLGLNVAISSLYLKLYPNNWFAQFPDNTDTQVQLLGFDIQSGLLNKVISTDLAYVDATGGKFTQNSVVSRAGMSFTGSLRIPSYGNLYPQTTRYRQGNLTVPYAGILNTGPQDNPPFNNFAATVQVGTNISVNSVFANIGVTGYIMNNQAPTNGVWPHISTPYTIAPGVPSYLGIPLGSLTPIQQTMENVCSVPGTTYQGFGTGPALCMPSAMLAPQITSNRIASVWYCPVVQAGAGLGVPVQVATPANFATDGLAGLTAIGSIPFLLDDAGNFISLSIGLFDFQDLDCQNWARGWTE